MAASLGSLGPARLLRFDANESFLDGDAPTKESLLHFAIYRQHAGYGAVVHLHSTHSVAVSILDGVDPADVLPPLTAYFVMRVGRACRSFPISPPAPGPAHRRARPETISINRLPPHLQAGGDCA